MKLLSKFSMKDFHEYMAVYTELVQELFESDYWKKTGISEDIAKVILKHVPPFDSFLGLLVSFVYKSIVKNPSKKDVKLAFVLGWINEFAAGSFLMIDDIMDNSLERNGVPCHHRKVGLSAALDALNIQGLVFDLLEKYIGDKKYFLNIFHLFQESFYKIALGENQDIIMSRGKNYEKCTMEKYLTIAKYKAYYFPIYTQIEIAMRMAGIEDENIYDKVKEIIWRYDRQYQVKDDYWEPFESEDGINTGTDICEGKFTWNLAMALQLVDEKQKKNLLENYGQGIEDPEKAMKVIQIYKDVDLPKHYIEFQRNVFNIINELIENLPIDFPVPREMFYDILPFSLEDMYEKEEESKSITLSEVKEVTQEIQDFLRVFPDLVDDLTENLPEKGLFELWPVFAQMLYYNVPHGKKSRGLITAMTYKQMCITKTKESINKAYILGWCVEILQAAALIADDIMDNSTLRRGMPCWYIKKNDGYFAFKDASVLAAFVNRIINKYFNDEDGKIKIKKLFSSITFKTALGQHMDVTFGAEMDFDNFTNINYETIVKLKTSYYTFVLPIISGMIYAGIENPEALNEAEKFLLEIGHFFQVQDDYLDCFGNIEDTKKIGTDICDGKCTWLVVKALEFADEKQKKILKENYGKGMEEALKVKEIYKDLKIEELYSQYENETYEMLRNEIEELPEAATDRKSLYMKILKMTYKRTG